jgi:hypothetical protein
MRIIEVKIFDSQNFELFVDIGYCEKHYDYINLWDFTKGERYEDWYLKTEIEPYGSIIIWLNYLLGEYKQMDFDTFNAIYSKKIGDVFRDNFELINEFNDNWFDDDLVEFKGLDLNWDGIEEKIIDITFDEDGTKKIIEFNDGTIIKFLDKDDTIRSFYVKETEYQNFKENVDKVIHLFKY